MFLLLLLLSITCGLAYYYITRNNDYWEKRGVPYKKPHFFFGHVKDILFMRCTIAEALIKYYKEFDNQPFVGLFELTTPVLLLRNPEIIKQVLTKDLHYFQEKGMYVNDETDPLSASLPNISGEKWRLLRTAITPGFTSSKIKGVASRIIEETTKLSDFIRPYADSEEMIDVKDFSGKFITEIMSTCFFGIETDSLKEEDSEFRRMVKYATVPTSIVHFKRLMRFYTPGLFKQLNISVVPKILTDYFIKIIRNIIEYRESRNIVRNDFMQILIGLRNDKSDKATPSRDKAGQRVIIDDKVIAAQAFFFFLAGFEPTSAGVAFAMIEIAKNPAIQQRLYQEIRDTTKAYGSFCSEALNKMRYLEATINETLRMHPPVPFMTRLCTSDYNHPGSEYVIKKGEKVIIPILGLHTDEQYYGEPNTFNPERFLIDNPKSHGAFLPFGDGPRICIGTRLAYHQLKAVTAALLLKYEFSICSKTKLPIQYDPKSLMCLAKDGIWLRVSNRIDESLKTCGTRSL